MSEMLWPFKIWVKRSLEEINNEYAVRKMFLNLEAKEIAEKIFENFDNPGLLDKFSILINRSFTSREENLYLDNILRKKLKEIEELLAFKLVQEKLEYIEAFWVNTFIREFEEFRIMLHNKVV